MTLKDSLSVCFSLFVIRSYLDRGKYGEFKVFKLISRFLYILISENHPFVTKDPNVVQ